MREIVHTLKAMLQEERRDVHEWVDLVPAMQLGLNTAFQARHARTPYHVVFGRAPRTSFSTLASSSGGDWCVDVLDMDCDGRWLMVWKHDKMLHKEVLDKVQNR